MGNHNAAIDDFQKAINLDQKKAMSYYHLGVSKLRSRHIRDAEDAFKESLQRAQDEEIPKIDEISKI